MQYYELKITLNLKKDLHCNDITEKLSVMFNKSMIYDEYLKSIHEANIYKLYTFEGLSPFERDKVYKCGRFYMTRFRCIDKFVTEAFRQCLKRTKTNEFDVLAVDLDVITPKNIKVLFNVTPAISIVDSKPWIEDMGIEVIKKNINDNLLKKIRVIQEIDEVLQHDMIKSIKIVNRMPIACKYKKVKFLGNKFQIEINEDEMSQYMAKIALAVGLLEKNSLGYGYCLYKK